MTLQFDASFDTLVYVWETESKYGMFLKVNHIVFVGNFLFKQKCVLCGHPVSLEGSNGKFYLERLV